MERVTRTNTILYCDCWTEMVAFYGSSLALPEVFRNDWFVEFAITDDAFVSVADAARSSVAVGTGAGLTLSWEVADLDATRAALVAAGVDPTAITRRFGATVLDVFDPAGNRLEFWASNEISAVE